MLVDDALLNEEADEKSGKELRLVGLTLSSHPYSPVFCAVKHILLYRTESSLRQR